LIISVEIYTNILALLIRCYKTLNMDLIKELDSHRLDNKITQQDLAEQLGACFVTVN
jgi:hypothetical protein